MKLSHVPPEFDVIVIGGGSAGYAAARTSCAAGLRTVVVEGGREVGGLCILRGCMPTKALLHAADVLHQVRRSAVWGLQPGSVGFDFGAVMARKKALIREFADYRRGQLADGRFEFIRDQARFLDAHTIGLAGGRTLSARWFVIATGSVVSSPPLRSVQEAGFLTSDEALELERLPKSLIVLGGGAVAVELAQFFQRFDVEVTLIQRSPQILRDFDPDAAGVVETVLRREGMKVFTGTRLMEARRDGSGKTVVFEHDGMTRSVRAEEILLALGRSPNTGSLDLAAAGVETREGRILTDAFQRTTAPHVFAAGDCTGPYEVVHLAIQQAEIAVQNFSQPDRPRAMDYRLLTNVVFTDPQLASVGLTEKAAREAEVPFLSASYPFADHGKSLIMEAKDGFVKLLADPRTGAILGGTCVGPLAGELIHEIVAAMAGNLTVHALAAMPHYHPTLAEIWTYPAEDLAGLIPLARRQAVGGIVNS